MGSHKLITCAKNSSFVGKLAAVSRSAETSRLAEHIRKSKATTLTYVRMTIKVKSLQSKQGANRSTHTLQIGYN